MKSLTSIKILKNMVPIHYHLRLCYVIGIWKFVKWNHYWVVVFTNSSGSNHVLYMLNEHENLDQYGPCATQPERMFDFIIESNTLTSPGVTSLYPSRLGICLTWSPCGHCSKQWGTCHHGNWGEGYLKISHSMRSHHEELHNIQKVQNTQNITLTIWHH